MRLNKRSAQRIMSVTARNASTIDGRVDVPLANHPPVDGSLFKLEALQSRRAGEPHAVVEGNDGFRQWMDAIHDCAGEVL